MSRVGGGLPRIGADAGRTAARPGLPDAGTALPPARTASRPWPSRSLLPLGVLPPSLPPLGSAWFMLQAAGAEGFIYWQADPHLASSLVSSGVQARPGQSTHPSLGSLALLSGPQQNGHRREDEREAERGSNFGRKEEEKSLPRQSDDPCLQQDKNEPRARLPLFSCLLE